MPHAPLRREEVSWASFVDKTMQSALLLIGTKLASAWLIAAIWPVNMRSRAVWGVIPYAGLETTAQQFRTLTLWSTSSVAGVAILWLAYHYVRRRHMSLEALWGAFLTLPMAALLASMEWLRKFDTEPIIAGNELGWLLLAIAVPAVLFLGFVETPADRRQTYQITPTNPRNARSAQ